MFEGGPGKGGVRGRIVVNGGRDAYKKWYFKPLF